MRILLIKIDTNGACPDDKEHHRYGANVAPAVGVSINVDVSKANEPEDAIIQQKIAVGWISSSICIGLSESFVQIP